VLYCRNCLGNTRLALPHGIVKHALLGTTEAGCPEGAIEGGPVREERILIGEVGDVAVHGGGRRGGRGALGGAVCPGGRVLGPAGGFGGTEDEGRAGRGGEGRGEVGRVGSRGGEFTSVVCLAFFCAVETVIGRSSDREGGVAGVALKVELKDRVRRELG
jgi:hypothetical protein